MLGEESRTENITLSGRASGRLASPDVRDEFGLETIDMNMGPQHPAMHGLLRLILELDGETVVRCDPIMGYLHRSKEKISENRSEEHTSELQPRQYLACRLLLEK